LAFFTDHFSLRVSFDESSVVLYLEGELDMASTPLVVEAVAALLEAGEPDVILDASLLGFMDSSGLNLLICERRQLEAAGGSLMLRNQGPQLRRLFEVAGLADEFPNEVIKSPASWSSPSRPKTRF
jgi:stage II sporulation protein AA (anti-sigma F factor antagonist)